MIVAHSTVVERGTVLPEPLRLEEAYQAGGWAHVADASVVRDLDNKLATAGWTFFYMAGEIRKTGFGFNQQKRLASAMKQLIRHAQLEGCNCLEIDEVASHSFLGVPYVSVAAHSRRIQQASVFATHE